MLINLLTGASWSGNCDLPFGEDEYRFFSELEPEEVEERLERLEKSDLPKPA